MVVLASAHQRTRLGPHAASWGWFASLVLVTILLGGTSAVAQPAKGVREPAKKQVETRKPDDGAETPSDELEVATLGSGCFWCSEAVFQQLKGVKSVVSGYSGGRTKNPTYEQVCTGATGHAEVIQVTFDPNVITFGELLEVFFKTHDPTTLNRQGPDHGTQYRSAIFYHDDDQKRIATEYRKKLDSSKTFKKPIVTEITAFKEFFPGEDYHQNYFRNHPEQPYCVSIIKHKVDKMKAVFKDKLDKTPSP